MDENFCAAQHRIATGLADHDAHAVCFGQRQRKAKNFAVADHCALPGVDKALGGAEIHIEILYPLAETQILPQHNAADSAAK